MRVLNINQFNLTNKDLHKTSKNMSFGRIVNGTDYPDKMVEEAERLINNNLKVNKEHY